MPGPYTKAKRVIEDAAYAAITKYCGSDLSGVTLVKGGSGEELTIPRVQVVCTTARPSVLNDGSIAWWEVELNLGVVTHYIDHTRAQREEWAGVIQDFVLRDDVVDILDQLTDVDNLNLYEQPHGWEPQECVDDFSESQHVSAIRVLVRCLLTLDS